MTWDVVYDPTVFVRDSIKAVVTTLLEAVLLVVLVVILFLQTWRASIIPLLAVPVSIIGTFAVLLALGFSINTLTLFGMVLAIGIVVDDAIVVVENVERNIGNGLTPKAAAHQAMREVSGPIIAIALVLCAVFVPIAFLSGVTGQFFRQFAVTIAISTVISAINSLTLSPALAAVLLRAHGAPPDRFTRLLNALFGWVFRPFNRFFNGAAHAYAGGGQRAIRHAPLMLALYAVLIAWHDGDVPCRTRRIHSDSGQALSYRRPEAARGRLVGSHRGRGAQDERYGAIDRWRHRCGGVSWTQCAAVQQYAQYGHDLFWSEKFRSAAPAGNRDRRRAQRASSHPYKRDLPLRSCRRRSSA